MWVSKFDADFESIEKVAKNLWVDFFTFFNALSFAFYDIHIKCLNFFLFVL